MGHRHIFEALDRSLRDIMRTVNPALQHLPFGGKVVVFGGDFRQVLPVVKRGDRGRIVAAALNRSHLWRHVRVMRLQINMRVRRLQGNGHSLVRARKLHPVQLLPSTGTLFHLCMVPWHVQVRRLQNSRLLQTTCRLSVRGGSP